MHPKCVYVPSLLIKYLVPSSMRLSALLLIAMNTSVKSRRGKEECDSSFDIQKIQIWNQGRIRAASRRSLCEENTSSCDGEYSYKQKDQRKVN